MKEKKKYPLSLSILGIWSIRCAGRPLLVLIKVLCDTIKSLMKTELSKKKNAPCPGYKIHCIEANQPAQYRQCLAALVTLNTAN